MHEDSELDKLKLYSRKNLQEMKEDLGEQVVLEIERLNSAYFKNRNIMFFHEIGGSEQNKIDVIKSGFLKSYEQIQQEKGIVNGSHTITERSTHDVFKSVSLEPDKYKNRVYFRLLVDNQINKSGVFIKQSSIPQNAWMNFRDPGHVSRDDIDRSFYSSSVSFGGFDFKDVFVGDDIGEAIVCKALQTMSYILHIHNQQTFKATNTYEEAFQFFENIKSADDRLYFLEKGKALPAAFAIDFINSPQFDEYFQRALAFTLEDISKVGQITLPQKVNVKNAILSYNGEVKVVSEWQKTLNSNVSLESNI